MFALHMDQAGHFWILSYKILLQWGSYIAGIEFDVYRLCLEAEDHLLNICCLGNPIWWTSWG